MSVVKKRNHMLLLKSLFLFSLATCTLAGNLVAQNETYASGAEDRAYMVQTLQRISHPLMKSLAENRYHLDFPVRDWEKKRAAYTHLEGFARTLSGLAPWLELGPDSSQEGQQRAAMIELTLRATRNAFDPESPDRLSFVSDKDGQNLVEAAYIVLAMLRAPTYIWGRLTENEQARVISSLKETRDIKPWPNNWLLFAALREAFILKSTGECQPGPIDIGLSAHQGWYVGDGTYGDGADYHWDYYNSYVIHPMLLEVLKICKEQKLAWGDFYAIELARAKRYATVLERLISPEGTYPVLGRSSAYRLGNMQLLTQLVLTGEAPANLLNSSTRSALTVVARRLFESPGTFDSNGWLQIGVIGHQNNIREFYNSTGALYITCTGFLHLGLPSSHPFWTDAGGPWTQRSIWNGSPDAPVDGKLVE